jgi:hypothetical protein
MATDAAIAEALVRYKGDEVAAAGWFKDLFKSREQREIERAERAAEEEKRRTDAAERVRRAKDAELERNEKMRRVSLDPRGRLIEDARMFMADKDYWRYKETFDEFWERLQMRVKSPFRGYVRSPDDEIFANFLYRMNRVEQFLNAYQPSEIERFEEDYSANEAPVPEGFSEADRNKLGLPGDEKYREALSIYAGRDLLKQLMQTPVKSANKQG